MPDPEQIEALRHGRESWQNWREQNADKRIDLTDANLCGANLECFDLQKGNFETANLTDASLIGANLEGAVFRGSEFGSADFRGASMSRAILSHSKGAHADFGRVDLSKAALYRAYLDGSSFLDANLSGANASGAKLRNCNFINAVAENAEFTGAELNCSRMLSANFSGSDLSHSSLIHVLLGQADLCNADLTGAWIYGCSAWDVNLDGCRQESLTVTFQSPSLTVDNLELGQFLFTLLNNAKLRGLIDTITSKTVLILGRFAEPHMSRLRAIKGALRERDYAPIVFDFPAPHSRTTIETVSLLARMARFIVADLSHAKSVLQELQEVVPQLPNAPVLPLLSYSENEPGMFDHFKRFPWVLPVCRYQCDDDIIANIRTLVITPLEDARFQPTEGEQAAARQPLTHSDFETAPITRPST